MASDKPPSAAAPDAGKELVQVILRVDNRVVEVSKSSTIKANGVFSFQDPLGNPAFMFEGTLEFLPELNGFGEEDVKKKLGGSFMPSQDLAKEATKLELLEERKKRLELKIPSYLDYLDYLATHPGYHTLFSATMELFGWTPEETWNQISLNDTPWPVGFREGAARNDKIQSMPASEWKKIKEEWLKGEVERDKVRKRFERAYEQAYRHAQNPTKNSPFVAEKVNPSDEVAKTVKGGRWLIGNHKWIRVSNVGGGTIEN